MNILVSYRGIPNAPGWATGDSVCRALRALGHEARPYGHVYQSGATIEGDVGRPAWAESEVDLLIFMECNDGDRQYEELLGLPCRKVFWDFDTAMHADWSRQWAEHFDHTFLANPRFLDKVPRSSYLPYAFDDEMMAPTGVAKQGAAIIGTAFPERRRFAELVGVDVINGLNHERYTEEVCRLRVHLHHHDSGGDGLLVCRIWETMGLGTCLLTRVAPILTETVSINGYMTYHGWPDCRETMLRLLSNPEEADDIGRTGREVILAGHTYRHRVAQLLEVASAL